MSEVTRASRMAIVKETTGTFKAPASGADFLALQEGFTTELTMETVANPELKSTIDVTAPIPSTQTPTATLSHVLRHSGVEGQAPQAGYSALLEATFGSKYVAAVEYDTVAGSTTTTVKVDVGEGVQFRKLQAVLVKHSAFPWEIGVIKNISGDDLEMLFALANAPALGTKLGKAVTYLPVNESFPSLSLHDYRGNGLVYVGIAGAKVASWSVTGNATEVLNASYTVNGTEGYWNPIIIGATDTYLDFEDDDGVHAAVITAKTYRSPIELASALQTAMQALTTETITVTYGNTTGKFTIATSTSTILKLLWNTGGNTANTVGDKIGFSVAADDTGALTYTSDSAISHASPFTPAFDSPGSPLIVKDNKLMIGLQTDNACAAASNMTFGLELAQTRIRSLCAATGIRANEITARTVTFSASVRVIEHKADWFEAMLAATPVSIQFNFGPKSASNFIAGQSGVFAIRDALFTVHRTADQDGYVILEIELNASVDASGNDVCSLNYL